MGTTRCHTGNAANESGGFRAFLHNSFFLLLAVKFYGIQHCAMFQEAKNTEFSLFPWVSPPQTDAHMKGQRAISSAKSLLTPLNPPAVVQTDRSRCRVSGPFSQLLEWFFCAIFMKSKHMVS